jgi:hypothetical protein
MRRVAIMTKDMRTQPANHGPADRGLAASAAPGRRTLIQMLQAKSGDGPARSDGVQQIADQGVANAQSPLPHGSTIQQLFGRHDVSHVRAEVGGAGGAAAQQIGAQAYATGDRVAFASAPDLHTAAHEAAHVVQQRAGVSLKGGVGEAGDAYEQHADRVADLVVAGQSAESTLDQMGAPGASAAGRGAVQRQDASTSAAARDAGTGFSGPSYARKGPEGSDLDNRRKSMMSPATFTQESDNTCLDAAKKIGSGIETLVKVGDKLIEKSGKNDWTKLTDKDLFELGKQVKDVANALKGIKNGWTTLKQKNFNFANTNFDQEPDLPKALDVLKASASSVTQAFETSGALEDFKANPNRTTAKAWASSVAKQFGAAKDLIGTLPFPPGCDFMKDYFQGLMGAPTAYITAFEAIADKHYKDLDDATGGSDANNRLRDTASGNIVWTGGGEVQALVGQAYTAPDGLALYNWLIKHREISGVNMETVSLARGKQLIIMALANSTDPAVVKSRDAWVQWVNSFSG